MKIKRSDFEKFTKDLISFANAKNGYSSWRKQDFTTTPLHSQKKYKQLIDNLYWKYKAFENREFEDAQLELDYLVDYISFYLEHAYSFAYDKKLKGDNGISFYFLDKRVSYKNSYIDQYENMILDVLSLVERGEKLARENQIPSRNRDLTEKKKICYYELALIYTFFKDVEKGIEYYKLAYDCGSLYSAATLVYIFTRDDYFDCDSAVEYYNRFKNELYMLMTNKLAFDNGLFHYYLQSTIHLALMHEKLGQYKNVISLINEVRSKIPNSFISEADLAIVFTDIYNRAEEKLKELHESKVQEILTSKYFSNDIVKKMSNDIKVYIETSLRVYEFVDSQNKDNLTLDYSATIIPIMKGVEQLLKIIANKYLDYLKECYEKGAITENDLKTNNDTNIDKYLLNNNKTQLKSTLTNHLEIGSAYYILYQHTKPNFEQKSNETTSTPRKTFENFCESLNIKNVNTKLCNLGQILLKVKDHRNNCAHDVRIIKTDADKCFKLVIHDHINLINELYILFGDLYTS